MKLQYLLPYYICILVAIPFIQGENTKTCPQKCYRCRTGDRTNTLCNQYCSKFRWCGPSRSHHYIDCTSCNSTTSATFPTDQRLNSDDKIQHKSTTSKQLSEKKSHSNTLLKYLLPTTITIVIIIFIIILVRKLTQIGRAHV